MPWTASDASSKTHKADTAAKKKQWQATANAVLAKSGDDASAIRIANAAVAKHPASQSRYRAGGK